MLGTVAVTAVLLESDGRLDANTENWTPAHIQQVLANVNEGLQWWVDTLDRVSATAPLSFTLDTTYLNNPVASRFEPISRRSDDYALWTSEFLTTIGFPRTGSLETDVRAFNHGQRLKYNTDWAFTIFVVNSQSDADGQFAPGGSFDRAFAFAGGLFMVIPSTRPASTYAHETGHMFWARDEYAGGGSFSDQRGYYNTQNINASNNPTPGFVQQPSIMASGSLLDTAYANLTSAASTLAMIGWQDSDQDGIFDILDVPHQLTGSGYFDASSSSYRFQGQAAVQTLPNLNSSGQRNDITINRIREVEVRFDEGAWQTVATPDLAQASLDLNIPVPPAATQIQLRARDSQTSVLSNIFTGRLSRADATLVAGINGSVWIDTNRNGLRDLGELGSSGWLVELVDAAGTPLPLQKSIEPDALPEAVISPSSSPDWSLTAIGSDTDGRVGAFPDSAASTGSRVFKPYARSSLTFTNWNSLTRRLQISFSAPTNSVQLDAIGDFNSSFGRIEAYNSNGKLLARYTTQQLVAGQVETMSISRDVADIAYVIAGGHANRNVKLDNFRFGPRATTTTDSLGTYAFPSLPSGNFWVRVTPTSSFVPANPSQGIQAAAVTAGAVTSDIDFGFEAATTQWRNPRNPHDVNDDGLISALDTLLIINDINLYGSRDLRGSNTPAPPFIDVTGDNLVSAIDVLQVVNFINANGSGSGEGEVNRLGAPPAMVTAQPAAVANSPIASYGSPPLPSNPTGEGEGVQFSLPAIDQLWQWSVERDEYWYELLGS